MIHLYALTGHPPAVGGLTGIDDAPLRGMAAADLHAVVSEHDRAPQATRARALAHAAATLSICRSHAAAPVRYGAHHADDATLRAALAGRQEELRATVDRVAGHLEIVVRFASAPDPTPEVASAATTARTPAEPADQPAPTTAGRAYLEGRLRAQRAEAAARSHAAEALRAITTALDPRAAQVTERDGPQGPERCLLVGAHEVDAVVAEARRLAVAEDRLVVGGPWPPYTFV